MSRKVFISVLGAGFYGECVYGKDDKIIDDKPFRSSSTRFIQQATLEYLNAKEWSENDAAYILVTEKAKEINWDETILARRNSRSNEVEKYYGLERVIKDMGLPFKTEAVEIKDGLNEDEIWDIFDTLISEERNIIREGDELYFDLTHGFRYLPMLVLVLGNYTKFLKRTKKCSITYGNFEMAKNGVAPIIDLLPLASLQDWTNAVADYLENGYAGQLLQLQKQPLRRILSNQGNESDEETKHNAKNLQYLITHINTVALERQFCRGIAVMDSKGVKMIKEDITKIKHSVINAFTPLIKKIDDSLVPFDQETNVLNTIAAAQWCYDNHQYQSATTFLEEGVISFFCIRHGWDYKNEDLRGLVTLAFNVKKPKGGTPLSDVRLRPDLMALLQRFLYDPILQDEEFVNCFSDFCTNVRNDYNHCGFRSKQPPLDPSKLLKKIENTMEMTKERIKNAQPLPSYEDNAPSSYEGVPRRFINLSNHPISAWSEEQLNDAKLFGEIQEMPFPTINPNATQKDIEDLVDEYVKQFAEFSLNSDLTVHVMGEMTFTYNLVSRLKAVGIRCVASTTERRTHLDPDGNKVSEFHFVQFREY